VLSIVEGFPRLFGRYALLTSFGRGGMGEVFLAKQRVGETARLCVVKTLRGDLADSREYIGRFKDEAHVVVQLNHAHISQVYEYGVTGVDHFLVMEFIHGVNLREFLQDQQNAAGLLDAGLAMFAVSTTLDALAYAHRLRSPTTGEPLRLVHRDVSPANVMVGFEGDVKLIDFGLAESTLKQEQTETRAVMGKVGYMSPEQARGDDVDGSCDQFAAAVMLYEAVVGDRFYGDWNTHQIWQKVGHGGHVPRRWSAVPEPLRPILSRALDADPRRRYPDCDAFRDDLDELRARLAPRANKTMLRETLRRLYAPRIDAEQQLIAGFAHVLPPAEGAVPPPSSSQSISSPRAAASSPATEPFLTSPSQPAGIALQPGRTPGAGPEAFSSSVPPLAMPPPHPGGLSTGLHAEPRIATAAPAEASSPFEPTMSSRAVSAAAAAAVENPARRNFAVAVAAAAGLVAVVGAVVVVRGAGGVPVVDGGATTAVARVEADAVLARPETKPAETNPVETKPTEAKPVETKPTEAKPVETKPAETKPAETKPVEAKPAETKPVATKPAEAKAIEAKPAATKPVETKPVETKPVATKPVETKPVETKPVETKPVETKPVETKPVETKPVETKPVETKPADPYAAMSVDELVRQALACKDIDPAMRKVLENPAGAPHLKRRVATNRLLTGCSR
jgi:serine/threonine protein kinase